MPQKYPDAQAGILLLCPGLTGVILLLIYSMEKLTRSEKKIKADADWYEYISGKRERTSEKYLAAGESCLAVSKLYLAASKSYLAVSKLYLAASKSESV